MKNSATYLLVQDQTEKVEFEGEFVKHYYGLPYCAIFETYPADKTRIKICRRFEHNTDDGDYGLRAYSLISTGLDNKRQTIGTYVIIGEVHTEKEAEMKIQGNINGMEILQQLLKEKSK